jgi:hypothetical protein
MIVEITRSIAQDEVEMPVHMGCTRASPLSALALDLFGLGVYTCSLGAAAALSFHSPLEGTEISYIRLRCALFMPQQSDAAPLKK